MAAVAETVLLWNRIEVHGSDFRGKQVRLDDF